MTKHKLFISYYHSDDEYYRDKFEKLFGDLFINKSVQIGDIADDLSEDYIKRLILSKNFFKKNKNYTILHYPQQKQEHDYKLYEQLNHHTQYINDIQYYHV